MFFAEERAGERAVWIQRLAFLGAWAAGSAALLFVSRFLAGRMVTPLEESRNRQTAFVAAASHELRSPLAVIQANAAPPLSDRAADIIQQECARLSRLVSDLLLAGTDAKTWALHLQPIDADALLIDLFDTFQPMARQNKRKLIPTLPDASIPPLVRDPERLRHLYALASRGKSVFGK